MQRFEHLITTRPHDIEQVLISDLHLSIEEPALVQAFLALLNDCLALPSLKRLFILGDWFEVWLGDDMYLSLEDEARVSHWLTPLINKLKQLRVQGCEISVMHGNRDFLLDRGFLNLFGAELITEPYTLMVGDKRYRLEHGDALCTDDKKYQWFRRIMRSPLTTWYLLRKPLRKRMDIADTMRQNSRRQNHNKAAMIMDVNAQSVAQAVSTYDVLLHGHTHRPHAHTTLNNKTRLVLGDWRVIDHHSRRSHVSAVIAAVLRGDADHDCRLVEFTHPL